MVTYYISPSRAMARKVREDAASPSVYIPMDVAVNGDDYLITAMIPGVKAEELQIEILEDVVSIKGEFAKAEDVEEIKYLRRELPSGSFARTLRLPTTLNAAKADAEVVNGVLNLRVPKAEEAKAKQIKVKTK
jgi:HSP20 family protein